jgi:nuclear transport factor 2 (NTF2) superfamily protein
LLNRPLTFTGNIEQQPICMEQKFPLPPFNFDTATQKVQMAEDAWNSKNPENVLKAYTIDSEWRNRSLFFSGRDEIVKFLTQKWNKEHEYKLKKELWAFTDNRIAVRFEYEYHDDNGQWFRAYGNENWEFDENGLMRKRYASINDVAIDQSDRRL